MTLALLDEGFLMTLMTLMLLKEGLTGGEEGGFNDDDEKKVNDNEGEVNNPGFVG